MTSLSEELRGEIASRAIRKHTKLLSAAVTTGQVPEDLFSEELIDEETFEFATNSSSPSTSREKGNKIMRAVRKAVQLQSEAFETFCSVLEQESSTKESSQRLHRTFEQMLESEQKRRESNSTKTNTTKQHLDDLKGELEVYQKALARERADEDAVHACIKTAIGSHIETELKAGMSTDTLKEQMRSLCHKEFVVPSAIQDWALQEVDVINMKLAPVPGHSLVQTPQPEEPIQPLFSKDTLYHASLCCEAVSMHNAANFKMFFQRSAHHLDEVSMSISEGRENVDQYLIASFQKTKTLYVAFQSQGALSRWNSMYNSFEEGLLKQADRIPLRFFIEQLLDKKKIVFTGFSFGGILACCVAAHIWRRSYICANVLMKSMVCITFGQPLLSIPLLQDVARRIPQFESTIHSVFDREDIVPQLLHYFNFGNIAYHGNTVAIKALTSSNGVSSAKGEKPGVSDSKPKKGFASPFSSVFIEALTTLQNAAQQKKTYSGVLAGQDSAQEKDQALKKLKDALQKVKIDPAVVPGAPIIGTCYVMSIKEDKGLVWTQLSKSAASTELSLPDLEKLEVDLFKKHKMDHYRQSTFRSHLEKEPNKYSPPQTRKGAVSSVSILKPTVKAVEFHKYPNEHVTILVGNNLWFCHKVSLGKNGHTLDINTPAQNITRCSIQFNCTPSQKTDAIMADNPVKVTLYSHFAEEVEQAIQAKQEPYSFSLRQMQLARHTPSEVIELAYWSAMLEQHSKQGHSNRFQVMIQFLEQVVQVVPLESIFHAIAYSENDYTALECANALMATPPRMGPSEMMINGSWGAAMRMSTGIPLGDQDEWMANAFLQQFLLSATFVDVIAASVAPGVTSSPTYSEMARRHPSSSSATFVDVMAANVAPAVAPPTYSEMARHHPSSPSTIPSSPPRQREVAIPVAAVPFPIPLPIPLLPPVDTSPTHTARPQIAEHLKRVADSLIKRAQEKGPAVLDIISNQNIEEVYPGNPSRRYVMRPYTLKPPVKVLKDAREQLADFIERVQEDLGPEAAQSTEAINEQMLQLVRDIREQDVQICSALLAAFMEEQIIHIPLLKSPMDTAKVLSSRSAPVAVGVWALFSMDHHDLQRMLSSTGGDSLTVEITDYIAGILDPNLKQPKSKHANSAYAAKLQFMLLGIKETISCSTQYISYSLEHQLCSNLKFDKSISVKKLVENWDQVFKGDALSLVAKTHQPLIARWLKWAVLVHDLREALASYTCVGVIGLINSGKSKLVNTLFKVQTLVGTTGTKRTTVPLMYNLDGKVDGLDVIDFPGVDDTDHSIPELAELLISLAQVVIFVVDYRKIDLDPAKEWLCQLKNEDIPVLVCLTHADVLYAELDEAGKSPEQLQKQIGWELHRIKETLGPHPSRTVRFYCFHLGSHSILTPEKLKEVNIGFPHDVGYWLTEIFQDKLNQSDLARKLKDFVDASTQL